MKKFYVVAVVLMLMMAGGMAGAAQEIFFEGEGYVVPSEKSGETFVAQADLRDTRAGGTIVVNAVSEQFPNIEMFVTVLDSSGNPVTGLTASDFAVSEQSDQETAATAQTLTCFEEVSGGNGISFSLIFDLSTSMNKENRLTDSKTAAIEFLSTAQDNDRASLVTFSGCDEGGIIVPVNNVRADADSDGTPDINTAISGLTTISLTALYDGIANGIDSIMAEPFPKGVIVFTDGNTNVDCHYSINSVIQKATAASIPVYTIGLAVEAGSTLETSLKQIADETGAYYTAAPTAADMAAIYSAIAQNIRNQYRLCYTTHNPAQDGTTRTVTVVADGDTGTDTYEVGTEPSDNQPPAIVHTPVTTADENQAVTVTAQVTDPDAGDSVARVTLFYRLQGSDPDAAYTEAEMTSLSGDTWQAVIPGAQVTPDVLEYYISAWDTYDARADSASAVSPYSVAVSAVPANQAPVAKAGQDQSADEGASVSLDGSASSDPDNDLLSFSWRQVSGPSAVLSDAATATPQFTAPAVGPSGAELVFELTVTDPDGLSSADTVSVMINDALAPVAAFTWSPDSQTAGEPVTFTDQSEPGASPIISWAWDFDNLGTDTDQHPVFTFDEAGSYTVRLTVTDEDGSSGTVVLTVTVSEPECSGGDCGGGSGGCFIRSILR